MAQNAFRALGLSATASQSEVAGAASSVRLALKLGVRKTFEGDAEWLAPLSRAESDVRDALGRLSEPSSRAFERLFWFHTDAHIAHVSNVAQLRGAVGALLSNSSPAARHDVALLALAGLLRLDPALEDADAWSLVFVLWSETIESEEFWSLLVAADLNGDYEQPLTFGEARRLRLRAPRLISAPVAEYAKDAVVRGDLRSCARAFSLLRGGGLPAPLLEEYERDTLGPAEDRLEELCGELFSLGAHIPRVTSAGDIDAAHRYNNVWEKFERKVKPNLRGFAEIGGAQSVYVRRALERAADGLRELAERYRALDLNDQCVALLLEARALAPPNCEASELIDIALLAQMPGTNIVARTSDQYAQTLARELAQERAVPPLPKSYVAAQVVNQGTSNGCGMTALFWVVALVSCFALNKCGLLNSKRSTTFPPANLKMINMNYNMNIAIPKLAPLPPMKIPSYLMPQDNSNTGRRTTRRRRTQKGAPGDNTPPPPPNLNSSPPAAPVVMPRLKRNAVSTNGDAPPPQQQQD